MSLLVSSRNRPQLLIEAVESVLAGSTLPDEIVVVDQSDVANETLAGLSMPGTVVQSDANPQPAEEITTLVHSMSHCLLRAFEDGQIGFAETSLAEWFVPETLTFALYANSLKSYTLGALWTLINNRTLQWLEIARRSAWRCENDPLCHQRHPRVCERCLYLTFGYGSRNDRLNRSYLTGFWGER